MTINKYSEDGVNVELGDDFSAIAGEVCASTYSNNRFVEVYDLSEGHFRGKRAYSFTGLPKEYLIDQSSDGIGTKVGLIGAAGTYIHAFEDLIAMTSGDMVAAGGLPLVMNNILDVSTLGEPGGPTFLAAVELMEGMKKTAQKEKLIIFKGETAELSSYVSSEDPQAILKFNWGATVTGVTHPKKIITGKTLKPGQMVVALRENGFRSNGISSVRKALAIKYGNHGYNWWNNPKAKEDILAAATPSVSYNNFIAHLHGWYHPHFESDIKLHAVAHITGGGIISKLINDIVKRHNLSVELENLFEPPSIMQKCIEWRGMAMEECYNTWNMGQGMLIVIDRIDFSKVRSIGKQYSVEVQEAGLIKDNQVSIIKSAFFNETIAI